jgi:hypothetical protein
MPKESTLSAATALIPNHFKNNLNVVAGSMEKNDVAVKGADDYNLAEYSEPGLEGGVSFEAKSAMDKPDQRRILDTKKDTEPAGTIPGVKHIGVRSAAHKTVPTKMLSSKLRDLADGSSVLVGGQQGQLTEGGAPGSQESSPSVERQAKRRGYAATQESNAGSMPLTGMTS